MIFSSNFFPCLDYFRAILQENTININIGEQYKKQNYFNRAYILGPHKVESIIVPVKKHRNHEVLKNIRIDYSENWHIKAWKTITNCYRKSPYFEFLEDYISPIFLEKHESLVELNQMNLTICLKILGADTTICLSEFPYYEYKEQFISFNAKNRGENKSDIVYQQVFGNEFEDNLSVLDLLFCKGRSGLLLLR